VDRVFDIVVGMGCVKDGDGETSVTTDNGSIKDQVRERRARSCEKRDLWFVPFAAAKGDHQGGW
jgi:hypothetical protein